MSRIKVTQDLGELSGQQDRILVMKDTSILDESDDEAVTMEDVEVAERERREQNQRRAQHGKKYNPYDDDWDQNQATLSKYDDFDTLENERRMRATKELVVGQSFNVRSSSSAAGVDDAYNPQEELPSTITLGSSARAYARPVPEEPLRFQSDFYTATEAASFKKVTKKDKKKKRSREEDEEDRPVFTKTIQPIVAAEEDEELYAQLSRLRRIEKEKISLNNEDAVVKIALQSRDANGAMPLSSTVSDFLSRIDAARQEQAEEVTEPVDQEMESPPPAQAELMEAMVGEAVIPEAALEPTISPAKAESIGQDVKVDSGLACALKFFQSRGDIEQQSHEARLEHRDDFGRILDPKEAYNHMSRKFHGKKLSSDQYHKQSKKQKADIASKKIYN